MRALSVECQIDLFKLGGFCSLWLSFVHFNWPITILKFLAHVPL